MCIKLRKKNQLHDFSPFQIYFVTSIEKGFSKLKIKNYRFRLNPNVEIRSRVLLKEMLPFFFLVCFNARNKARTVKDLAMNGN